jgi:hypothetical protein
MLLTNGTAQLQGRGQTGVGYIIEATPTLDLPILWIPLSTNTADASGLYQFIDGDALSFPMRFYRVRQAQ